MEQCNKALTDRERNGISHFKFQKDRNSFILSNGLLRILLSAYLNLLPEELEIARHRNGKPYLLNAGDFFFNISNSGDCCIFAFSRNGEVGIDIEKIRPLKDMNELIERNFTPKEQDYINKNSAERANRFFKFWTLKESYLKAIGEGMRLTPDNLEFSLENGKFMLQSIRGVDELEEWVFNDCSFGSNYAGTLAHQGNSSLVSGIRFI